MHTKRFQWMLGLAIISGLFIIGCFLDGDGINVATVVIALILNAVFSFFAWRFKDERRAPQKTAAPEESVDGDSGQ